MKWLAWQVEERTFSDQTPYYFIHPHCFLFDSHGTLNWNAKSTANTRQKYYIWNKFNYKHQANIYWQKVKKKAEIHDEQLGTMLLLSMTE
jgi:hypothetical protein